MQRPNNPFDDDFDDETTEEVPLDDNAVSSVEALQTPAPPVSQQVAGEGVNKEAMTLSDDAVGRYLLEKELMLTALEFYQESLENGKELEFLRQCFEDKAAQWHPTEDTQELKSSSSSESLAPMGRTSNELSRIMKEKEDRIVLLEYELRLSKDDIQSLKTELKHLRSHQLKQDSQQRLLPVTESTALETPAGNELSGKKAPAGEGNGGKTATPPTEQERRRINHLIRRYLVERGYKLTAITFGEEAEDELDLLEGDAESTGSQSLTALHRHYYHNPIVQQLSALQTELKEAKEKNVKYQERVDSLEERIGKLAEEKEYVEKELDYMRVRIGDRKREHSGSFTILARSSAEMQTRQPPAAAQVQQSTPVNPSAGEDQASVNGDRTGPGPEGTNIAPAGSAAETSPREPIKEGEIVEEAAAAAAEVGGGEREGVAEAAPAAEDVELVGEEEEQTKELEKEKEKEKEEKEEKANNKGAMRRRRSERLLFNLRKTSIADATRIQKEVERIVTVERDNQGAVKIVAECLPHIVPGVLLNTREELIPVILVAIRQHPDTKTRDHLTQMLFNLIKIPDENQRRIIMDGCVALSRIIGQDRTGSELLPQCWEQISSKHKERRALVAESCGALAPFVQTELRPSLILSILIQLLDDKSPLVRAAVARNLGILVSYFEEGEANKYQQVQELLFRLLKDPDISVLRMTQDLLLPMLVDWADTLDYLSSHLLITLLAQIQHLSEITEVNENRLAHLDVFLSSFSLIIPRFVESVLLSSPFGEPLPADEDLAKPSSSPPPPSSVLSATTRDRSNSLTESLCILSSNQRRYLTGKLSEYLKEHCAQTMEQGATWPALEWLTFVCIPKLIDLLVPMIGVSEKSKPHEILNIMAKGMTSVVVRLCREAGDSFVQFVLQPQFLREITEPESEARRLAALQVYVVGVLPFLGNEKLAAFLRELTLNVSLEESGWNQSHLTLLNDCLELLSKRSEEMSDHILALLWDLVVHPSAQVRQSIVKMFDHMSTFMEKERVTKRVLPALLTLGNDIEASVRVCAVMPIGYIAINIPDNVVLERINVQFETWEQDEGSGVQSELIAAFTNIIPQVKAVFRDAFLLPKLVRMAERNNACTDSIQRQNIAKALLDAFRAFHGIVLSQEAVRDGLLPGLSFLQNDFGVMDSSFKKVVRSMLHDMQAAAPATPVRKSEETSRAKDGSASGASATSGGGKEEASATSSSPSPSAAPSVGKEENSAAQGGGGEATGGEATVNKLLNRWKQSSTFSSLKAWGSKDNANSGA